MEKPKRSRSANWDPQEKLLLKECIKDYITALENKTCDTNTNKKKQEAWKQVLRRFNELNKNERGLNEIKQQWRCTKLEAKKSASIYKRSLQQTGGGQKPPSPPPEVQEIINMIPHEFEEDYNTYDSDNVFMNIENEVQCKRKKSEEKINYKQVEQEKKTLPNLDITFDDTANNNCIDNQITLEEGISRQTDHVTRDKILPDKTKYNCKNKMESVKGRDMVLIECLREEHQLKMKQMTEAHQWAREEHEHKMKHLKLQINILEKQLKDINTEY